MNSLVVLCRFKNSQNNDVISFCFSELVTKQFSERMSDAVTKCPCVFQLYRGYQALCAQSICSEQGEIIDTTEACTESVSLQSATSYKTASGRSLWMTSFGTSLRDAVSWVSSKFTCKFLTGTQHLGVQNLTFKILPFITRS